MTGQGTETYAEFNDGIIRLNICQSYNFCGYILVYQKILSKPLFGGKILFL
jgi:hypothetical protein